jgi:hypothetical protein
MRFLRATICALLGVHLATVAVECRAVPPEEPLGRQGLEDLLIPKKTVPYNLLGVNAFVNDPRFGSIRGQFRAVKDTLRLRRVRILFAWNEQIQPTPSAEPFFGFYDEIVRSLPAGVEAVAVLTGVPPWMNDSRNWLNGDPRETFVELWVKKVISRYRRRGRLAGYQIWNEPNNPDIAENVTLDVLIKPDNYVELLARAHAAIKDVAPRKKVINAATTAIAQNFPDTLDYNKAMVDAGILSFVDAYAVHYYGKNVERVLLPGGIADFLNGLGRDIWITESGERGVNRQLEYAQRIFPFLRSQVPLIRRIYWYQFTEDTPADSTYGMLNLTPGASVSDLYVNVRDRRRSAQPRSMRRALADSSSAMCRHEGRDQTLISTQF